MLHGLALSQPVAGKATDPVQAAVQVDYPAAACALVQPIHVLGDQQLYPAAALQPGQGVVGRVGTGVPDRRPAPQGAQPVTLPATGVGDEFLVPHRLGGEPATFLVPVGGDARTRTDTGTRQHHHPPVAQQEAGEQVCVPGKRFHRLIIRRPDAAG